jgi:hypothetical protein
MSQSVFEMRSVELFCYRPLGARYVICDEWHYTACLGKAADLQRARAETREFLDIAELNHWSWQENPELVRKLIASSWLFFHHLGDRNPDTDGWWVIVALLKEVRRGSLLAIKGPRHSLFPSPYRTTPLRNLVAKTGSRTDGEPMLSVQYDSATRQARSAAARAARVGDRNTPTMFSDATPFELGNPTDSNDALTMAARGVNDAQEAECFVKYEVDMELCSMTGAMYKDSRTYLLCKQRAFENYQQCRGY